MHVNVSIISRRFYFLTQQSKKNIRKFIDERLPEEYEKCLVYVKKSFFDFSGDYEYSTAKAKTYADLRK